MARQKAIGQGYGSGHSDPCITVPSDSTRLVLTGQVGGSFHSYSTVGRRVLIKLAARNTGRSHGLPVALIGRVVEDLVEVYALVSSRGRLTAARPTTDVDHKDFIFDERGGYRYVYLQVKGVTQTEDGQVRIIVDYPKGKILSDPRFLYLFCLLDVKGIRITRMWLVPSKTFNRLAPRGKAKPGRVRLLFGAGSTGKWSRFMLVPTDLGNQLVRVIRTLPKRSSIPLTGPQLLIVRGQVARSAARRVRAAA